ncbi:MAG TPA: phenylalanine--tRNA ligase subunit alpha [Exilispira sp.]|nr:phenylalanine--tRNA ligase subunit alpha [Exilispira sp.]
MLENLKIKISEIEKSSNLLLSNVNSKEILNKIKTQYLGKKGEISELYKILKDLSIEEKKIAGQLIQSLESKIKEQIEKIEQDFYKKEQETILQNEWLDITIPSDYFKTRPLFKGHLSPISSFIHKIQDIFLSMGFTIADGPQLENDYYNFTALNIPENHPARDLQDTFWMTNGMLLRTHTSPIEIRMMQKLPVPLKLIAPGRVFRNEATDASHENTFYQIEGLMIDRDISVANLTYFMKIMLSELFETDVKVRLRPGYFPFVEPGFELDFECLICHGKGCPVCKHVGWVELVGCGLSHPEVLKEGGVDPEKWSAFAFGLGLNRLVMMKLAIDDIRWFESGDLRFFYQF